MQRADGARMTLTGPSLGTPQYMSLEQAMGEKTIDARAGLYALGAVTHEMLVWKPPFTGPSVQAIVSRVPTEDPRPTLAQRRALPELVSAAVPRALEKPRAGRPLLLHDPTWPGRRRNVRRRLRPRNPSRRGGC